MLGSRPAFRFARQAAMKLGRHPQMINSQVAGGCFMQNCFMTSVPVNMSRVPTAFAGALSEFSGESETSLELLQTMTTTAGIPSTLVQTTTNVATMDTMKSPSI